MTNTVVRLFLFVLAVPLLIALIVLLPQYGHLGVIVLLTGIGALCGAEMRILMAKFARPMPWWSILITTLPAPMAWSVNMGWMPRDLTVVFLLIAVMWALSDSVFAGNGEISNGVIRIGTRLLMVMYPGWLLWWVARLTWFDHAAAVMLIFMFAVFLNDSGAWLFGKVLGRHRNVVSVSPNKSLEGFIGGVVGSVIVILVSARLRPDILPHPLWQLLLFGIVCAFTTIMGDLTESAVKRSAGVKDSGGIIPGRGGMLDSIDSILFTAPVFVLFLEWTVR